MNEKLKQLIAQFEAKHTRSLALLNKAEGTQEEFLEAQTLQGECEVLRGQIMALRDSAVKMQELSSFLSDPQYTAPQPVTGGAVMHGFTGQAGSTVLTANAKGDGWDMEDFGDGLITNKQWAAIHESQYKQAYMRYLRSGGKGVHALSSAELKVLQEGIDDQGGYLVPADLLNKIIQKTAAPTRIRGRATNLNTSRERLALPKVNYTTDNIYTTGMRVTWTGEVPASSTTHRVTEPVFGQAEIPIFTAMMSLPLTNDLVEDNAFGLLNYVGSKFGETANLLYDNMILNGTGIGQPRGIQPFINTTNGVSRVLSGTANAIAAATTRSLPYLLPEQYINDNTAWYANRSSFGKTLAEFVATTNEFLFSMGEYDAGLGSRTPDTLAGFPLVYSAFMSDIGDGLYPAIFGDMNGYYVVNRVGMTLRYLSELYAETNQVVLLGRIRFGGDCLEPFRLLALKSDDA